MRNYWYAKDLQVLAAFVEGICDKSVSTRNNFIFLSKLRVGRVLVERIHPSISDGDACKIKSCARVTLQVVYVVRHGGDVVPGIALSRQKYLPALVLWISKEESLHELIEVFGYLEFIGAVFLPVTYERKARSYGLVDIHHVCFVIPRVLVVVKFHLHASFGRRGVLVPVWAIFGEECQHTRAARATV